MNGPVIVERAGVRARWALVAVVVPVVVALDQLTKWWALQVLDDRTIDLVWTLRLRLIFNTGSAFGLGSRFAPLIALVAVVVIAFVLRAQRALTGWPSRFGAALVVGGAVGNLLDRLFREGGGLLGGAVVDFVDLQWWPVFNVADACIVVGGALLALCSLRRPAPEEAPRRDPGDPERP